jgi:hypothetical protein
VTASLDLAIARVRALSEPDQDAVASLLLELVVPADANLGLSEAQVDEIKRRQSDFERGRTAPASPDEVASLWARCGI